MISALDTRLRRVPWRLTDGVTSTITVSFVDSSGVALNVAGWSFVAQALPAPGAEAEAVALSVSTASAAAGTVTVTADNSLALQSGVWTLIWSVSGEPVGGLAGPLTVEPAGGRGAPTRSSTTDVVVAVGDGDTVEVSVLASPALAFAQLYRVLATVPEVLVTGAITRNSDGAVTSAAVTWPDGTTGEFTASTLSDEFPGAIDAYAITYGSPASRTYTQPAVTRNTDGAVTTRPAITEA